MKNRITVFVAMTILALCGYTAVHAEDEEMARDHIKIEKETLGGASITIVEGLDATAEDKKDVVAADEAVPRKAKEHAEMPSGLVIPHKARLAVLPAVFSKHFQPVIKMSETVETSGQVNLKMVFTSEHESRMEAPSFTLSLAETFVGSRKFDVLERARLNETLKEIDFGESDYADAKKVVPMGLALNAEYVVLTEIEVIHLVVEAKDVPYVDTFQPKLKGKMIVRTRVVDTASTKMVASCTEEVQVERKLKANNPFIESEINNLVVDLYEAASLRSVQRTLEAIYPVRLLEVVGDKAVLNRGEGAIRIGDEFDVYTLGKSYVDPDTKELLGQSENRVALIKVNRISPKFSDAQIVEGEDQLSGDLGSYLCRETTNSIATKTQIEQTPIAW